VRRRAAALIALVAAAAAIGAAAAPARDDPIAKGRALFAESCASCHGDDARGIPGTAPDLHGVGALAADFYLRTGRMPLQSPDEQPHRAPSPFSDTEIRALVAFVGSFGGPGIPAVHPERGDVAEGLQIFGERCMGCHQVLGKGGIVTGAQVPALDDASALDVAEAVQAGPYVMPKFGGQLDAHEVDSLARYVAYAKHPDDEGGWGIGHIGPIPEGMVAWFLGAFVLLLAARVLGKRMER
jgi:ubiquinol-cytochrome c reductase cytochrome c subunit